MQRITTTFLPEQVGEGTEFLNEFMALLNKKYGPLTAIRTYTPWLGVGNILNTLITEIEWDSLRKMEDVFERAIADHEIIQTMAKWMSTEKKHKVELYTVID